MAVDPSDKANLYPWPLDLTPACQGHPNPELWFPFTAEDRDEALTYCDSCPIQALCLEIAVTRKETGVWGNKLLTNGKEKGLPSENHSETLRKQRLAAKAS